MKKVQELRYYPIGLFASVMGFAGVTLAINHLESLYGTSSTASFMLLVLTSLMFIINAGILMYRFICHREDVKSDFNHPVKMNFFGAITISLLLLAVAYFSISESLSFIIWSIGTITQIGLTLIILSRLIWHHTFQIQQFNPTWFIPIVGNIIVPVAGTLHIAASVNWIYFSIGTLFSIMYMTIFFNRMFFHSPFPNHLLPTFYILMAPPAIGFVSYLKMVGNINTFGYMLYGTAFFIGLLLLFQLKRFLSIPFSIAWWAFLFPSAAMTLATIHLYIVNEEAFFKWLFHIQIVGLIALSMYLAVRTILLAFQHKLCVKE